MYLDLHDAHDIANKIYKGFLKERTKEEKNESSIRTREE